MATALIGGLLKQNFVAAQVSVVEINVSQHAKLHNEFGVQAVTELETGVAGSDVIVLAVKPQQLHGVATSLAPLLTGQLLISMVVAQALNSAEIPILGTYIVGRNWFFVVLWEKSYAVSNEYNAADEHIYKIFSILQKSKEIMMRYV